MNLPNKLTLTRIILVPVFMIFVSLTSLDSIVDGNSVVRQRYRPFSSSMPSHRTCTVWPTFSAC